ncbi:MAG: hypothetical protein V4613_01245 [Bacteroidota bacterium]
MKPIKQLLIAATFILSHVALTAQTERVNLPHQANDEKARKLQAIIAVYHYTGQPFEDPVLNGLETKSKPNYFTAKLPNLHGVQDTDYAYFFFGGVANHSQLPGYMMAIVTNNTRNDRPCHLWFDKNYNLDFTDDGAPDTFYFNTKYKDIKMMNPNHPGATYTVRISRFPFNYNTKYLAMLDDYYAESSGKKKFAGAFFSFKEERLNVKAGDYKNGNDSFRLAIKDANCNGLYDDNGTDALILGDYKKDILPDNKLTVMKGSKSFYFEKNGKHYDIKSIDPLGNFIDLSYNPDAKIKNALVVGAKLKKFKFNTTEKDKKPISIRKFKKKPTYIYVWRFGEAGFAEDTAALRTIQDSFGNKINLITLNYGEKPKQLQIMKRNSDISWLIGFSTAKINEALFIERYPTGILTKKRLRVKQIGISPSELLSLLRNNLL